MSAVKEPRTLEEITASLGKAYKSWKGGERKKDDFRKEFFAAIDAAAAASPEDKLITVELASGDSLADYVEREYPAYTLDDFRQIDQGKIEAIIVLKPELTAFTFVNVEDGQVYVRQFVNGSPVLDDERLRSEEPDLWIEITEIPNAQAVIEIAFEAGVHHREVEDWVNKRWIGPRTLKPLDSLDGDTMARVQPYVNPGKPSVKLAAPRKAKPEELGEIADDGD